VLGTYDGAAPAHGAWIARRTGGAPDLLVTARDGLGASVSWSYAPLSGEVPASCQTLYRPPLYRVSWATAPRDGVHSPFASSMHVVARMDRTSGVGAPNGVCYAYEDAWMHRRGRGFLGFGRIIEWEDTADGRNDLRTTRTYHRDFPLNGRPVREVAQLVNDTIGAAPIERTLWTWSVTGCTPDQAPAEVCNVTRELETVETRDLSTRAVIGTVVTRDVYTAADRAYGNVSARIVTTSDAQQRQVVRTDNTYDYSAASSAWWIDRLQRRIETFDPIVTTSGPAAPAVPGGRHRIVTEYTYRTAGNGVRRVEWERLQPGDAAQARSTYTEYDAYGNPTLVRTEAARAVPRTETSTITADGYFVASTTSAVGHVTQVRTDAGFGAPTVITDPNGLITSIAYDGFGRRIQTSAAGAPAVYERLLACTAATCPPRAVVRELTIQAGAPSRTRYLDALERPVRETVGGFGAGEWVIDRQYDPRGRLIARSEPAAGTPRYFTRYLELDARGRPGRKVIDRAGQPPIEVVYRYTGLDTTIAVPGAAAPIRQTHDLLQRLVRSVDASGGVTTYRYDPRGNLSLIRDAAGNDLVIDYDARGRKLATRAPDRGVRAFQHDGHDQVLIETDANGQTIERAYDRLGRPTTRLVGGVLDAEWRYDRTWRGALDFERGSGGRYCRGQAYDGFGRPTQTTTFVDGRPHTMVRAYDGLGRDKGLAYPSGRVIGVERSDRGYLVSEYDAATGVRYRTITAMSPHGEVMSERFGNGLVGVYDLDPSSWQAVRVRVEDASPFGTTLVQDLRYEHAHPFGQLTAQRNALLGVAEIYEYDEQLRIARATRTQGTTSSTIEYDYDAIGNLVLKSDHSLATTYGSASRATGNAGPHGIVAYRDRAGAVVSDFLYDDNGNLLRGDGLVSSYDAYDRPLTLTRGGQTVRFAYGAGLARFERVTATATTHYVDRFHERIVAAGAVTQRDYVGERVVIARLPSGAEQVRYLHLDRLGSVDTTTDEARKVVDANGYDPFGGPRNAKWIATATLGGAATDRGFTGHEHVDPVRVIHMNGRAYDYALGRFLSADPYVVDPADARSLDPYSYVRNDPLGRIDPTGYQDDATREVTIESIELVKVTHTGSRIAQTEVEIRYSDGTTATLTPSQAKVAFGDKGLKALAVPADTNRPGTAYRIVDPAAAREPEERSRRPEAKGQGNAKVGVRVGPLAVKTDGGDVSVEASTGWVTVGAIRKENGNPAAKVEVGPRFEPMKGLELRATAGVEGELAPDAQTFTFGKGTEYVKAKLGLRTGGVSVEPELKVERKGHLQLGLGTADAVRAARERLGRLGGGIDYVWDDVHGP
jgi:RHS repeat-associated protein